MPVCRHEPLEGRLLLDATLPDWTHLSSNAGDIPESALAGDEQTASLVIDLDADGIDDFVIAERTTAPSVVWFRRTGDGWQQYVIDNTHLRIEAGGAATDIDGDGDLDIVFGGDAGSNGIWWWENPSPAFDPAVPWVRRTIKNSGSNKHHDQIFGDFDGDGADELVTWNQGAGRLYVAEIPDDAAAVASWNLVSIYTGNSSHEGLAAADIDLDGVTDIIGAGRWYEHVSGTTFTAHTIDAAQVFTRAAAGQLIAGGRPEVIFVPGDADGPMKLYQWTGSSWSATTLIANVRHGHSLQVADVNLDGHLDIFTAEMHTPGPGSGATARVLYGDSAGGFTEQVISVGIGNHESRLGDLDGDGDLDILTKPYTWDTPRVDVWINGIPHTLPLDQWQRTVVDASRPWTALFVDAADIDGDGDRDLVTGGWWYANPGPGGGTWTRRTVGSPLNNMTAVYDFDGDGDMDILGTAGEGSASNDTFVWARNDGTGTFTVHANIASGDGDFLQGAAVDRFSPGGPVQVALSWHAAGKGVQMLTVPADPTGGTWTWQRISATSQDEALSSGDIDRDGDADLLLGTRWLRNDGAGWSAHTLNGAAGLPDRNRLADVNGDGRLDAIVGYEAIGVPGKLAWYEQPAAATGTWTEHVIASTVVGPMSLDAADLDRDGDVDLVVGEHSTTAPATARLWIFENADGAGGAWTAHLVHTGDEHHDGAILRDIDLDGDLDILSIGWTHARVMLYENKADPASAPNAAPAVTITNPRAETTRLLTDAAALILEADVTDDGRTAGPVTSAWTVFSAPAGGTAVFDNPAALATAVRFSGEGTYVLRLSASDGQAGAHRDVTVIIGAVATPVAPTPDVAWWTFDEGTGTTAADPIGGHTAAVAGAAWTTDGVEDGCLRFDGVDDAVNLGAVDIGGSALTLAAWINPDDFGTYDARILSKANGVQDADHWWMISTFGAGNGTGLRFRLKTNGTTGTLISPNGVLQAGRWQHVAATYDGAMMRLYVDGVEVASMSKTGALSTSASVQAAVGNNPPGVEGRPFDGRIDDVRLYASALDSNALKALMDGQPPNTGPAVDAGADRSAAGTTILLDGTAADDGTPDPPAALAARWTLRSGPASALFADPTAVDTIVAVPDGGTYVFRLTVDDGQMATADDVTIVFPDPPAGADFDFDGDVDLDDFVILKQHFGADGAARATGDANNDDRVDLDDFVVLKQHFGTAGAVTSAAELRAADGNPRRLRAGRRRDVRPVSVFDVLGGRRLRRGALE
ncbi:MAG: hypothetical protein GX591_02990 [Planctomycetes bacterium]|nr:hypothetical protein [Planctomycetota bacterium]